MIVTGLVLAAASAVAINGGYAMQHAAASRLPPLSVRSPVRSFRALVAQRRWLVGFLGGHSAHAEVRVSWDQMDLSDPRRPKTFCALEKLLDA